MENKKLTINFKDIPIESSLGLLAYGDIAFTAWRKVKKETKEKGKDEKEK